MVALALTAHENVLYAAFLEGRSKTNAPTCCRVQHQSRSLCWSFWEAGARLAMAALGGFRTTGLRDPVKVLRGPEQVKDCFYKLFLSCPGTRGRRGLLPHCVCLCVPLRLCFFSFFFCLFAISWAAFVAYGGSQTKGLIRSCSCQPTSEPQQRGIRAASATSTTAHGNTRSLTH